ncbi:pyridoxal-phosphate dependent enzyme [Dyadobacter tibetensis]|uniref:pyridoxal-phosphate dependent enzyme n=1 Tax=Dyadobacter tibetensis TaxID=1211851 RepID=UPI000471A395|nr:pyridoxal-phosphate dependent enzyme [Dyadobacter tibetensis]
MNGTVNFANSYPSENDLREAHQRITPFIHRTPLMTSQMLNELTGAHLFFKPENLQKIGAFKIRGALNAMLSLDSAVLANGLATHSSGNHAQAIACAAALRGIKAYIVMPHNAPKVKVSAVRGYGASITFCENTPEDREAVVARIVAETGATFIHPFNHYGVMEGQATVAKEMIEDSTEPFDYLLAPVGGGGLLSGTALSAHYFSKNTLVIGAEPEGAADAVLSLQSGSIQKAPYVDTIADGLLTYLGDKTFPVIHKFVSEIVLVSDQEIVEAMRLIWERMKLVVEPSGAVTLAAIIRHKKLFEGKRVGVIVSGGNVDLGNLPF